MQITNSTYGAGLDGIRKSLRGIQESAHEIATMNGKDSDGLVKGLAESMVSLKIYQQNAEASGKVIEVASQTMGSIIDLKV